MGIDNVTDVTPRVQYTAIAAQVAFDYPFPIFEDADLVVDVDGVTQTLTTHYTVSGATEDTGGTVTFVTAPGAGAVVTIYRDTGIARTSDFGQNGPFLSAAINDEIDQIYLVLQELENKIGRCVRFPLTSASSNSENEMNPISGFTEKYLRVDSTGKLEAAAATDDVVALSASTVGAALYAQTTAESSAGVTPSSYQYEPGNVLRYGAVSGSDSTAAFISALSAYTEIYVPEGTFTLTNVPLTSAAVIRMHENASLLFGAAAADHMIESTANLKIIGGTINGNRANRTYSQSQLPVHVTAGQLELIGVKFTGTQHAAFRANGTPDLVRVDRCQFVDMAEHTGTGDTQTLAGVIRVDNGSDCEVFLTDNYVAHGAPSVAGRNPGGFLWDGGTDAAGTGIKRVTATGNKFYNIGQNAASNFIACLHGYTTGGDFLGNSNYFYSPYWVAILLQNSRRASVGTFVIDELVNGINGVQVQIARSYTPTVADIDIGRGIINYASGATTGIGWAVVGEASGADYIPRIVGGPIIVDGGASAGRIQYVYDVCLHGMVGVNCASHGILVQNTSDGAGTPTNAQVSLIGGSMKDNGAAGVACAASNVDNLRLVITGMMFEGNTTRHVLGTSLSKLIVNACEFADDPGNIIQAQSADMVAITGCTAPAAPGIDVTSATKVTEAGNSWQPYEETAANLADVGADINTAGKYTRKIVYDTTNNRLVMAASAAAAGDWEVVDGSAQVTPS